MSDHRDEFAVAACLDPQNAETVLLIVVRDALDKARHHFQGGWVRPRFHDNCRVIGFASAGAQSHSSAPATPWRITTLRSTGSPLEHRQTLDRPPTRSLEAQFFSRPHLGQWNFVRAMS
jgi:hypothetical protein